MKNVSQMAILEERILQYLVHDVFQNTNQLDKI